MHILHDVFLDGSESSCLFTVDSDKCTAMAVLNVCTKNPMLRPITTMANTTLSMLSTGFVKRTYVPIQVGEYPSMNHLGMFFLVA
jgi:hypothetical protein